MGEVEEAIQAYWRSMRRKGWDDWQIGQPSRHSLTVDNRVILGSFSGYKATYHLGSRRVTWSERDKRYHEVHF